jgi:hypothetical protein
MKIDSRFWLTKNGQSFLGSGSKNERKIKRVSIKTL